MKAFTRSPVKRMKLARVSILLLLMLISILAIVPLGKAQYTCTIRPNANGDVTELYPRPPSLQNWDCVDETPSDEDYSYVASRNLFSYIGTDLYNLQDPTFPSDATISSVMIYMRVRSGDNALPENKNWFCTEIKTHGNRFTGTVISAPIGYYETYSTVYTTNPHTGNPWTKAEVEALQAGVRAWTKNRAPDDPWTLVWGRCTQVWVEVQYLELTVLAEDQYGNSLTTGDVYIDGELVGYTGSSFTVQAGDHEVFVNDFWEAGQTGNRYSFEYYYYETTKFYQNPLYLVIYSDTTVTAHFKKKWCPGDTDGNGVVTITDVVICSIAFGSYRGDPKWDSRADHNCDGVVDIVDVVIVSINFGKVYE